MRDWKFVIWDNACDVPVAVPSETMKQLTSYLVIQSLLSDVVHSGLFPKSRQTGRRGRRVAGVRAMIRAASQSVQMVARIEPSVG